VALPRQGAAPARWLVEPAAVLQHQQPADTSRGT
jgi:hypothetical protein